MAAHASRSRPASARIQGLPRTGSSSSLSVSRASQAGAVRISEVAGRAGCASNETDTRSTGGRATWSAGGSQGNGATGSAQSKSISAFSGRSAANVIAVPSP